MIVQPPVLLGFQGRAVSGAVFDAVLARRGNVTMSTPAASSS
jgi:hypothetical protein